MRTIIALAMILTASVAPAQERPATVAGAGVFTCAQFAQYYKQDSDNEGVYFTWAQGFMSGLNFAIFIRGGLYKDLAALSNEQQQTDIRNYCDQHPLVQYREAVLNLYDSLPMRKGN